MRRVMLPVLLCVALAAPAALAQGFEWPKETKNVKVLPKDLVGQDLAQRMREFTAALGVRCSHCHAGEGSDLTTYDFASDAKPTKETARTMLRMAQAINETHLAGLVRGNERPVEVRCVTCHRGLPKPRLLQDVLVESFERDGVDAAIAKYGDLREKYYGSFAYDFGEGPLVEVAQRLGAQSKKAEATRFLDLSATEHPDSLSNQLAMARLYAAWGERDRAVGALERALALATPEQAPAIRRSLERMTGAASPTPAPSATPTPEPGASPAPSPTPGGPGRG